jgi:Glutamine synthetase adenylyltransferase
VTRARVVWASDDAFRGEVTGALERILRRPRPDADLATDIRKMRDLMARERPASGFWDLKLSPGGQVDAEFLAQFDQLLRAADGRSLTVSTVEALADQPEPAAAWVLQQQLAQVLSAAFDERPDPSNEPAGLQQRLATMAGATDFDALVARLRLARAAARTVFERRLPPLL